MYAWIIESMGSFLIPLMAFIFLLLLIILLRRFSSKKKITKRKKGKKAYSEEYLEKSGNLNAKISDKGTYAEYLAYDILSKMGYSDSLYPNVYVETNLDDIESTEIDLLMLTNRCIISFEIKNYAGAIFGREKEKYWTQKLSGKAFRLYNPLRQNYAHCEALKKLLPFISENRIVSLVVFNSRCLLKVNSEQVITMDALESTVKRLLSGFSPCFTAEQVHLMKVEIEKRSKQDQSVKQRHVEQVKQRQVTRAK